MISPQRCGDYRFELLAPFVVQIAGGDIPGSPRVLSDGIRVWMVPEAWWCETCVMHGIAIARFEYAPQESANDTEQLRAYIQTHIIPILETRVLVQDSWGRAAIQQWDQAGEVRFFDTVAPAPWCSSCQEGSRGKLLSLSQLENIFGLCAQLSIVHGGGLSEAAGIRLPYWLGALVTTLDESAAPVLCSSLADSSGLARTKVLMELCERLAFAARCARGEEVNTSSGYAAHTTREGAILHSLLECIERDACMRWWHSPLSASRCEIPVAARVLEDAIESLCMQVGISIQLGVLYVPSTSGVPVAIAFAASPDATQEPGLIVGSGAAFSFDDAVVRAMSELWMGVLTWLGRAQQVQTGDDARNTGDTPDSSSCNSDAALVHTRNRHSIMTPEDHARWWQQAGSVRAISALEHLVLHQEPTAFSAVPHAPRTLVELLAYFHQEKIEVETVDCTPAWARDCAVVVCSKIAGYETISFGAHAGEIPHCFN